MGVQVSKADLAGAVGRAGGVGCISSVGLGTLNGSLDDYIRESNIHLTNEIHRARELAPNGILAVNVMVALSNYDEIISVCVKENVDIIISGAGLPLNLPALTNGSPVKLIPVISSARAANLLIKTWHRRYNRIPDAIVIEGPLCGGHLGFSRDQIDDPASIPIGMILQQVRETVAPYEAEYGRRIPMVGAEAISNFEDAIHMLNLGFDGVQIGTRFICSEESGLDPASKEVYAKATQKDLVVIQSPMGMPLRVIRSPFVERLLSEEKIKFYCPFRCLRACDAGKVKFCLADAMVKALIGYVEGGIYSVGCGIDKCNEIIPAEEFFVPFRKHL
jgi:NAD(P)H-dependent flavin oxidoreductase YrpB (nitropropane dioxygenase family)